MIIKFLKEEIVGPDRDLTKTKKDHRKETTEKRTETKVGQDQKRTETNQEEGKIKNIMISHHHQVIFQRAYRSVDLKTKKNIIEKDKLWSNKY